MSGSWAETLHDEILSAARRLGVPNTIAAQIALSVEERFRREYSTRHIYIHAPDINARNRKIVEAVKRGEPKTAVARRFQLSPRRLNSILRGSLPA